MSRTASTSRRIGANDFRFDYQQYDPSSLYWEFVNAVIVQAVFENFQLFLRSCGEGVGEVEMEGRVEEMLRQHDIVSLRVYVHVFESSSAHPTEIVTGLNFFGEEYGCMKLDEIFGDIESETKRSDFYLEQGGIVMCEPEAHATCERSVKWGSCGGR